MQVSLNMVMKLTAGFGTTSGHGHLLFTAG
jgi:hypothetical protein